MSTALTAFCVSYNHIEKVVSVCVETPFYLHLQPLRRRLLSLCILSVFAVFL